MILFPEFIINLQIEKHNILNNTNNSKLKKKRHSAKKELAWLVYTKLLCIYIEKYTFLHVCEILTFD